MTEVEAIQEKRESDSELSENNFESSDEYSEEDTATPASRGNIVNLDVGGQLFKTRSGPLMKKSSYFKKEIKKNETDSLFVDRSPKHFDFILNFVRDGYAPLPYSETEAAEILVEAKFYKIAGLVKRFALINSKLPFNNVSLDEIKEKANGVLEKPLLQIFYLFDDKRGLVNRPSKFSIKKLLEKNENELTIQFYPVDYKFQSHTAAWNYRLFNTSGYEVCGPRDTSFKTFAQQLEQDIENIDQKRITKIEKPKTENFEIEEANEQSGQKQLLAVLNALEKVSENKKAVIFNISTSDYVNNCLNKLIYQWQTNGWVKKEGDPVANQFLLKTIIAKIRELRNNGKRVNITL